MLVAHILFVHGMNVELRSREIFERKWFDTLAKNLREAFPERDRCLPAASDCSLLYWSDMLPPYEEWADQTKGVADDLEQLAAEEIRKLLRRAAGLTSFEPEQVKKWQAGIRVRLEQSVLYMSNLMDLQTRVQKEFARLLRADTCIVIGHSLGSVIAYQGLVSGLHSVDLLITVGSPLGTPKLIYDRLAPHEWPNVNRWCNYSAVADVWSVPTPSLRGLFRGPVRDVEVHHGSLFDLSTHRLDRYLAHREILSEIESTWRAAASRP